VEEKSYKFNPPPGWPTPPDGWVPPKGWKPPDEWSPLPEGWELWVSSEQEGKNSAEVIPKDPSKVDEKRGGEAEADSHHLIGKLRRLEAENQLLKDLIKGRGDAEPDLIVLEDEAVLQEIGLYKYHHPLENAVQYKDKLDAISRKLADLAKAGKAIERARVFSFDGSAQKGERLIQDLSRLMLQAYNAEASNCIRSLRAGNVVTAIRRVDKLRGRISKLGQRMEMKISENFHKLRLEEIELTSDFLMKKKEEKEAAREERARLREEKKVQEELANERERLDKEREHLLNALGVLGERGETDTDLERRLGKVNEAIQANDFRAANIRAGYVYVISNRGAFGDGVVKIGLTRRLEPLQRIHELSGASVPFRFDVHGLFFSEDAVGLESELHRHFSDRKVNRVNSRKEFFFASPKEVQEVLLEKVGALLEFNEKAESVEYLQSKTSWESSGYKTGVEIE
jgi:uncharacterized protein DUF4041/Meiotically Up-regulated Gene 113 (MUG113) protein